MSIITIELANRKFKLSCSEENQQHLLFLASKLDNEIEKIAESNPSASFELLLVMASLSLMDAKQSSIKSTAGELIEEVNVDFQKQLSSIFSELKNIEEKL